MQRKVRRKLALLQLRKLGKQSSKEKALWIANYKFKKDKIPPVVKRPNLKCMVGGHPNLNKLLVARLNRNIVYYVCPACGEVLKFKAKYNRFGDIVSQRPISR